MLVIAVGNGPDGSYNKVGLVLRVLLRSDTMDLQVIAMVSGRKAAFTNLWIVRIVVVPFATARTGLLVMGAELLLWIIVDHVYFGQIYLLFFQYIAA